MNEDLISVDQKVNAVQFDMKFAVHSSDLRSSTWLESQMLLMLFTLEFR